MAINDADLSHTFLYQGARTRQAAETGAHDHYPWTGWRGTWV
jgi:hypothetical protein